MGSVSPMLADIQARTGQLPEVLLADANHAAHACIEHAASAGVELLVAVPKREQKAKAQVSPAVIAWRARMQTEDAKRIYRSRAALCELSNAHLKHHRGAALLPVRGLAKVTCVVLLAALAGNILAHTAALLA